MDEPNSEREEDHDERSESALRLLAYLLQSGQIRLVAPREDYYNRPGEDVFIESDDSDYDETRDMHSGCRPEPEIDICLDKLESSELKNEMMMMYSKGNRVVAEPPTSYNVPHMLKLREIGGCCNSLGRFSKADCSMIGANFLPNKMRRVATFGSKAFCGQFSADGSVFISACQDHHIRLYETAHGKVAQFKDIRAQDVHWSILDVAFSPDQNYVIYSSWADSIYLCNVYSEVGTQHALNLQPDNYGSFATFSVKFSSDNKEVLAGCNDGNIYIYDRERDERILRISAHEDDVNTVCYADHSGQILFSGGDDGLVKVWDRRNLCEESPEPVGTFAGHSDGLTYIDSKGDARYLISNSKDQSIKLWDMRKFASERAIESCRRIVAQQHWDYRWQKVPKRSRRLNNIEGDTSLMTYRGHGILNTLIRCYFSPVHTTGQRYIYTGCYTGNIIVYDVLTGKIVTKLERGHKSCVRDVSWHPHEPIIMSSSWDCTLGCWEYSRKRPLEYCSDEETGERRTRSLSSDIEEDFNTRSESHRTDSDSESSPS